MVEIAALVVSMIFATGEVREVEIARNMNVPYDFCQIAREMVALDYMSKQQRGEPYLLVTCVRLQPAPPPISSGKSKF